MILILLLVMMMHVIYGGDNSVDWCLNGSPTATTDECICSSHLGYFCEDSDSVQSFRLGCQSGYGISFYSHKCTTCSCTIDTNWVERKKAKLSNMKRQQQNSK